ncbi:uncharacterized protein LOC119445628 [Dermacentor silvarum]|uniref:uncharacterized protein LOC119445628 n=1 Tax=Dermacentor silvarum TaxID=543639 RepID=UPI00210074A1|nr:uncharacterized protein LOC119445628 [Dermacentor silvarum]
MTVTEGKTGVSVVFQGNHRGHDFDLCHVFLSKSEKGAIATKLREGVPTKVVLEGARSNLDETFRRVDLLTRQDLYNVMRDAKAAERLDVEDYVSVQLWVEMMHGERDNPVLFFKHQGQPDKSDILERRSEDLLEDGDFMLVIMTSPQQELFDLVGADCVCVDGTHGRTAGFGLQVVTVLCVDESGAPFPVAYCVTNRTDQKAMITFFVAVRSKTGQVVARAFITDDVPSFNNAWQEVMGPPQQHFLCAWHVDKSWRQAIKKHIRDKKQRVLAYKAVESIMDASNEETLEARMQDFLLWFGLESTEEAGLLNFKEYFLHHYAQRAESWAACVRKAAGIKKNMHLGALHKVLKHWHSQGKTKRVDKLVSVLLKVTRDTVFDHLAKFVENTGIEFEHCTTIGHTEGLNIEPDQINSVAFCQWTVHSQMYAATTYSVTLEGTTCSDECRLGCHECKVCVHNVACSCADYELRRNLCKHIHAVFASRAARSCSPYPDAGDVGLMDMPDEPQWTAFEVEAFPDVGANVEISMDLKQDVLDIPKTDRKEAHCYFGSELLSDDGLDISDCATREEALGCLSDHNYCWEPYAGTQTEETAPAIVHSQAVQANILLKAMETRTLGTQT